MRCAPCLAGGGGTSGLVCVLLCLAASQTELETWSLWRHVICSRLMYAVNCLSQSLLQAVVCCVLLCLAASHTELETWSLLRHVMCSGLMFAVDCLSHSLLEAVVCCGPLEPKPALPYSLDVNAAHCLLSRRVMCSGID